jgi:hypothetical protein
MISMTIEDLVQARSHAGDVTQAGAYTRSPFSST